MGKGTQTVLPLPSPCPVGAHGTTDHMVLAGLARGPGRDVLQRREGGLEEESGVLRGEQEFAGSRRGEPGEVPRLG